MRTVTVQMDLRYFQIHCYGNIARLLVQLHRSLSLSLSDGLIQKRLNSQQGECAVSHKFSFVFLICIFVSVSQYISSRSPLTVCQSALSSSLASFIAPLSHFDPRTPSIKLSLSPPVPSLLLHSDHSTCFIINTKCCPRGRIQENCTKTRTQNNIHYSDRTSPSITSHSNGIILK